MSQLNSIIRELVDENAGPTVVVGQVVPEGVRRVLADTEATQVAVTETVNRRLRVALTRRSRALAGTERRQGSFFGDLRECYAIDVEERIIKQTTHLTRDEFNRVMEIRREQIAADRAHLSVLEHAAAQLEELWDANPSMTFGQVERLFVRHQDFPPIRRSIRPDQPGVPGHHA